MHPACDVASMRKTGTMPLLGLLAAAALASQFAGVHGEASEEAFKGVCVCVATCEHWHCLAYTNMCRIGQPNTCRMVLWCATRHASDQCSSMHALHGRVSTHAHTRTHAHAKRESERERERERARATELSRKKGRA